MKPLHFVYLLKCSDNTLYCGYTNNLEKRISVHNQGKGSKYTRGRTPIKLIYVEEYSSKLLRNNSSDTKGASLGLLLPTILE